MISRGSFQPRLFYVSMKQRKKGSWRKLKRPKWRGRRESLDLLKEQRFRGKKSGENSLRLQRNRRGRKEEQLRIFGKIFQG